MMSRSNTVDRTDFENPSVAQAIIIMGAGPVNTIDFRTHVLEKRRFETVRGQTSGRKFRFLALRSEGPNRFHLIFTTIHIWELEPTKRDSIQITSAN